MNKDYNTLLKDWQAGRFDPVYLFHGEEDFLIDSLCEQALNLAIDPADRDFNFDLLYGNEVEGAQIVNAAASFPMMAERRLVVVKSAQALDRQSQELVVKYIQKPSPSTCLILAAGKLDSKSPLGKLRDGVTVFVSKRLYENRIPDWIRSRLSEHSITITPDAIRLLQATGGTSLRALNSELQKILINLGKKKQIDAGDIESVVGLSREYNVFELCDAVGRREIQSALHIAGQMLQMGEAPLGILTMLVRHFTLLAKIQEMRRQHHSEADLARELHLHRFFLKNYISQSQLYTREQFRSIFALLLEADLQFKTSYQKPRMILELLVLKISKIAAEKKSAIA